MKKDIHPKYNESAKIICACGNTMKVGSTVDEIKVDLCSTCHPFFTGKQKLVDTARRVEKFQGKVKKTKELAKKITSKKEKRAKRAVEKSKKEITVKIKKEDLVETVKKEPKLKIKTEK